jgi:ribosome biogenesis GTPase / thiamine phosphate phosphatase
MDHLLEGTVYKKNQWHYLVRSADRAVLCRISNRLRKVLIYPIADPNSLRPVVIDVADIRQVDPVAVGDQVRFTDAGHDTGMILEVLPRWATLARRAAGKKALEQVLVANLDQVVPVFSAAQPAPKWNLLDRYLVSAESTGLDALICLTKIDLVAPDSLDDIVQIYSTAGYPVYLTSATTGEGLPDFMEALRGKRSAFMGKSGVGKTTLLNALQPGLGLRVNEVSGLTGKGKHTTTELEMFDLDFGGSVIDTPGIREFGLWEVDGSDLAELFPEMRPWLGNCRYGASCQHDHEPECGVKAAVARGQISEQRYQSYLRLL